MKTIAIIYECDADDCEKQKVKEGRKTTNGLGKARVTAPLPDNWVEVERQQYCEGCKLTLSVDDIAGESP